MSVTFFDFDGCLVDTAYECAVVAWCAREGVTASYATTPIDRDFLQRFYEIKPYVRYAREYVVFDSQIYEEIQSEADLRRILEQSFPEHKQIEYQERFYAMREAMKGESFEAWLALNRPYDLAMDALRIAGPEAVIISGKDEKTISQILNVLSVKTWAICDHKYAGTKRAAVEKWSRLENVELSGQPFLDDNLDHLIQLDGIPVRPVLASWGYVSTSQLDAALGANIDVATEADVSAVLGLEVR